MPGVKHVEGYDFSQVIGKAKELPGLEEKPGKEILVGFGHNAVLGVADKVIDAVKKGAIRRFFVVGGCDGAKPGRNYYTELVEKAPKDTVILTLACGKYRFNTLDLGDIGGIPRLLDVGQCNDTYSAVQIALALADAFKCGVNDLPLSIILSWYEQKAVAVLLTLLHLGIKNIKIGPSLPAFITPNVLNFLVEKYNIGPIGTPRATSRRRWAENPAHARGKRKGAGGPPRLFFLPPRPEPARDRHRLQGITRRRPPRSLPSHAARAHITPYRTASAPGTPSGQLRSLTPSATRAEPAQRETAAYRTAATRLPKERFAWANSRSENDRGAKAFGWITAKRTLSFFLVLSRLLATERSGVFYTEYYCFPFPRGQGKHFARREPDAPHEKTAVRHGYFGSADDLPKPLYRPFTASITAA